MPSRCKLERGKKRRKYNIFGQKKKMKKWFLFQICKNNKTFLIMYLNPGEKLTTGQF